MNGGSISFCILNVGINILGGLVCLNIGRLPTTICGILLIILAAFWMLVIGFNIGRYASESQGKTKTKELYPETKKEE